MELTCHRGSNQPTLLDLVITDNDFITTSNFNNYYNKGNYAFPSWIEIGP